MIPLKLTNSTIRSFFLIGFSQVLISTRVFGQCELVGQHEISWSDTSIARLEMEYGARKRIPENYKAPILLALSHFPELRNIRVRFRVRHAFSPLTTNRDWCYYFAHFGLGRRAFVVTISDRTTARLSPILFSRLDFNARVGVAGHELSHVSDFLHKNLLGWLGLGLGHLSARWVDRFEFSTDSLCIAHGLGYNLLAWSCFVRSALHIPGWEGASKGQLPFNGRERYMNPLTILSRLKQ